VKKRAHRGRLCHVEGPSQPASGGLIRRTRSTAADPYRGRSWQRPGRPCRQRSTYRCNQGTRQLLALLHPREGHVVSVVPPESAQGNGAGLPAACATMCLSRLRSATAFDPK
jgi:hypothetical protein